MRLLTALLAASLPIQSDGLAQLLPAGEFSARDGRPGPGKTWKISDAQGAKLTAAVNAIASKTPVVIDYEHQTLNAAKNGQPAPAAGWIKSATWRPGEGMFSAVEWTAAAKAAIDAGEYRYISPVISYDASGQVTGLQLAALTNFPALLGMDAVVSALNTHFNPDPQETHMELLTALIAALGLPAASTGDQAITAVTALKAAADAALGQVAELTGKVATLQASADVAQTQVAALSGKVTVHTALLTELGLQPGADESAALTAVKTLKAADSTTAALVTHLTQQVATLSAANMDRELTGLVEGAITAGKFLPAHRDWLMAQGRANFAALKAQLESAPVFPGLAGQAGAQQTALDGAAPPEAAALTAHVLTTMGLTPEQFAKGAPKA